ncbi:MAG: TonB family protein [Gemmatimonadota bacterium]
MHDSSLPQSADVTPRLPLERPKLRPLIGVPEGATKENRKRGAVVAILAHLFVVFLLVFRFRTEITAALTDGAGGPGAAGGGGGGRGGSPVIPERIQQYQLSAPPPPAASPPSVLPPIVPVPEVKKPVVTPPPEVKPTPVTSPTATEAPVTPGPVSPPAPGAGAGAGAGTDAGPGTGPGTGGGTGSGIGTGTGSAIGPGTGGGNATIFPPTPRALFVPPNGTPRRLRGKTIVIELEVDETGKVLTAEFTPRSGDGGYDDQLLASLREQRFRPAVRANGTPVKFTYRYEILL